MSEIVGDGYVSRSGPAPPDAAAEKVWDQIMALASRNALIVGAYGGVATLAIPSEQRKAGVRELVLRAGLFRLEKEKHVVQVGDAAP